jgi:protein-L-isoaspartate(D-aspartate) O-methyltransferase
LYFQLFYDNNMLESISRQVSTVYFADLELTDQRVKTVLGRIPRDQFVPEEYRRYAYENTPLPIGYGQTISQPYIVGLMTELLALKPTDRVLEIGTGSGYQTAVLAELAAHVYSIETVEPLAKSAQEVLTRLGYDNISFRIADGYFGWEEASPFDTILIAAAAEEVPPPLKEQLANGGRLVLPIGPPGGTQTLWRITKQNNNFVRENKGIVRFVPFTRRK